MGLIFRAEVLDKGMTHVEQDTVNLARLFRMRKNKIYELFICILIQAILLAVNHRQQQQATQKWRAREMGDC